MSLLSRVLSVVSCECVLVREVVTELSRWLTCVNLLPLMSLSCMVQLFCLSDLVSCESLVNGWLSWCMKRMMVSRYVVMMSVVSITPVSCLCLRMMVRCLVLCRSVVLRWVIVLCSSLCTLWLVSLLKDCRIRC